MRGAPEARPTRMRARDLVAATPDTRNRYVDLLRVISIGVVVLGHWTIAVLGYRGGTFTGSNLLELDPDLQIITWVFQVMPLFFIVGGFTNGTSWISASGRGTSYADWLRGRCARLIRPALWFVGFWTVLPVAGVAIGILPSGLARTGGVEVSLPLWFLAVYLASMIAIPPLAWLHRRLGPWTIALLAGGALVIDVARYGLGAGILGAANYAFVWLGVMELGFLWAGGALRGSAWVPAAMAAGGLSAMGALVAWFDYPISMIALTHAPRNNVQPPTLALLFLAVWQCGATLLFQDAANRWLARPKVWLSVVVANSMVMTFYLWNMTAVVLAAVLLFPTGIAPQPEPLGTAWWLLRPAWWIVCAICLAPFLLGFRWAERPAAAPTPARERLLGVLVSLGGTLAAAAGLALMAANAFPVPGEVVLWPAVGVGCLVAGAVLLRVDPLGPRRASAA